MRFDNTRRSLLILGAILLSDYAAPALWRHNARALLPTFAVESAVIRGTLYSLLVLLPVVVALAILIPPREWRTRLGLEGGFVPATLIAVTATLPMFLGNAVIGTLHFDAAELYNGSLRAGVVEEIIYRGFLFGLLFRYCGWSFMTSALVGSFFFGIGHGYQGADLQGVLLAVGFAGIGAVWFAWLYSDFGFNLWLPIALHVLMNASVDLFQIGGGVALGPMSNLFRLITIVLAIVLARRFRPLDTTPSMEVVDAGTSSRAEAS